MKTDGDYPCDFHDRLLVQAAGYFGYIPHVPYSSRAIGQL